MNRMEEYQALLESLNREVPALETTLDRACRKKQNRGRKILRTVSAAAASFVLFVLLVNYCAPVAYACSLVPGLRELAAAVTFSPSMKVAVENDYVQPMELSQTIDGITVDIEYLIVDQKQVNVFYRLKSKAHEQLAADPEVLLADGESPASCSYSSNGYGRENGELCCLNIDFVEGTVPDALHVLLRVYENSPQHDAQTEPPVSAEDGMFQDLYQEPGYLAEFDFLLEFDPAFTASGRVVPVDQTVELEGQKITITSVQIYPTHMRVDVAEAEENTAWLKGLEFYIETDLGMQFAPVSNGIISTGSADSPSMVSYRADSSYFYEAEDLKLVITGAKWLKKEVATTYLNLETGEAGFLPEGAQLESAERRNGGWLLTFRAKHYEGEPMYQLFDHIFYDADGNEYEINSWSTMYGDMDAEGNMTYFLDQFALRDYPYDEVWLSLQYSHLWTAAEPVVVNVQ